MLGFRLSGPFHNCGTGVMADDNTVGFIGLGVMGEPMCRNILRKSGRQVLCHDVRPEPAARSVAPGAAPALWRNYGRQRHSGRAADRRPWRARGVIGTARFSECGRYRYDLRREWLVGEGAACFVMLNPSTADEQHDDPTVVKCIRYAMGWGYRELHVLNLFALRSTDPKALYRADDPVGPENDDTFRRVLPRCRAVVCAWGNHGVLHGQYLAALAIMREHCRPQALAITKEGHPQHPLYLRADLLPEPYGG